MVWPGVTTVLLAGFELLATLTLGAWMAVGALAQLVVAVSQAGPGGLAGLPLPPGAVAA